MKQTYKIRKAQSGFSLAELSVVLVIVSLVVGMSLSAGQTYMASMRTASIQHQLASVREALHLFRTKYGRYPCPARENDVISSATYGYEVQGCEAIDADVAGSGIIQSDTYDYDGALDGIGRIVRGMIPFKSLGITQSSAIDPWNNKISYAIDMVHVVSSTVGPGTLQIVDSNNNSLVASPVQGQAVFALISHGEDGNGAYPANSATQIACGTGAKAVENCDDDDVYMDALPTNSSIASEQYDDYVLWYAQQREDDVQQTKVQTVDTGTAMTCAIKPDKTLWCWGNNSNGQIGDGTTISRPRPTQVSNGGSWKAVDIGTGGSVCAIKSDDTLWCWGGNYYGQLGDNTTVNKNIPIAVNGGGTWKAVSIDYSTTCGIKMDDTLWCWGYNADGQVGDNTTVNKKIPTAVNGGGTWKAVIVTNYRTCAIKSDDTLWCWGDNASGQVGDNSTVDRKIPTTVNGGGTWKTVIINDYHSCAIKSDDTLWCWGLNDYGQVGDNTTTNKKIPTAVNGGGAWKAITNNRYNSCGIKSDDTLWCWGWNVGGELGDGTTVNKKVPTAANGGQTWQALANNQHHNCAINFNDTLWCWGVNGQLIPTMVNGGGKWKNITANHNIYCAIKLDDTLWCWDSNYSGQLGNGTYADYSIPIPVAFPR